MVNMDAREIVINDVVRAMAPLMEAVKLQMLEAALRNALHGLKLEIIGVFVKRGSFSISRYGRQPVAFNGADLCFDFAGVKIFLNYCVYFHIFLSDSLTTC